MELAIREADRNEIFDVMRRAFDLPETEDRLDEALLACCLRRIASFKCPCSYATMTKLAVDSFRGLISDEFQFKQEIEKLIDQLFIYGDLLELSDVSINEIYNKGTWLFAAAPAFLTRQNGKIFVFGVARDEVTPVPFLEGRILFDGCKRLVLPEVNEDLPKRLREFGILELTESSWLKLPKKMSASDYLSSLDNLLSKSILTGNIADLIVIDPNLSNKYYTKRMVKPVNHTGRFVARRPQEFGAPLWCYAELIDGQVNKFIDIPCKWNSITQRGCDGAWQLQMAIDAVRGNNQKCQLKEIGSFTKIDFFSPIANADEIDHLAPI